MMDGQEEEWARSEEEGPGETGNDGTGGGEGCMMNPHVARESWRRKPRRKKESEGSGVFAGISWSVSRGPPGNSFEVSWGPFWGLLWATWERLEGLF